MHRIYGKRFFGNSAKALKNVKLSENIGFNLTSEQLEYQQLARKFTAEHIIPAARYHDETGEYPVDILKKVTILHDILSYVI